MPKSYLNESPESRITRKLVNAMGSCKRRAHRQGVPYDLDSTYIRALLAATNYTCPVFDVPFDPTMEAGGKPGPKRWSASIDRIVPSLGYVKGNVRIISSYANGIMSNAPLDDIETVVEYLRRQDHDR